VGVAVVGSKVGAVVGSREGAFVGAVEVGVAVGTSVGRQLIVLLGSVTKPSKHSHSTAAVALVHMPHVFAQYVSPWGVSHSPSSLAVAQVLISICPGMPASSQSLLPPYEPPTSPSLSCVFACGTHLVLLVSHLLIVPSSQASIVGLNVGSYVGSCVGAPVAAMQLVVLFSLYSRPSMQLQMKSRGYVSKFRPRDSSSIMYTWLLGPAGT
jgi:hypothetical protein